MDTQIHFEQIADVVAGLMGSGAEPVMAITDGAYSRAVRWLVTWPDGRRAFVKAGRYPDDDHGLHIEHAVYAALRADFHPAELGWHEGNRQGGEISVLILEDLSSAHWGTPLTHNHADALAHALDQIAQCDAPSGVPRLPADAPHWRPAWAHIADDPQPLLTTGIVDAAWLERNIDRLVSLEARAELSGDSLVHGDLWRQNWCHADSRGAVLVDWAGAVRANAIINQAWGACGLRAAGGPGGRVFTADHEDVWATWMCGRALDFAIDAAPDPRPRLVETTLREAAAALTWMCEATGLEPPRTHARALVAPQWRP